MKHVATLLILILVSTILNFRNAEAEFSFKVDPFVTEKLTRNNAVDVVLHLSGHADLTGADQISDRTERVRFVYEKLRDQANRSQSELIKFLDAKKADYRAFYINNSIVVNAANADLLALLQVRPEVLKINYNAKARLTLPVVPHTLRARTRDDSEAEPNISDMHVDQVWNELKVKGKGIVVAGEDTGVNWNHPALRSHYRGLTDSGVNHDYNWHDAIHKNASENSCGVDSKVPCDDGGDRSDGSVGDHGTHTMGSMVGDDGGENHIGVAPEAKWIACRNMDNGAGTVASYTECMEFFLAPYPVGGDPRTQGKPEMAPHIINNSWGCPPEEGCKGNEFIDIVRAIKAAGIMFVVALGNEGPNCNTTNSPPGTYYGEVLAVGAWDHYNNDAAFFSSRGPSDFNGGVGPDIVAPGNLVRSAVNSGGSSDDGLYDEKSGTSMSSPNAAGVVALLWSARPELIGKIQQTIDLIHQTATPKTNDLNCGSFAGNAIPNPTFGYGLLDAYKLLTAK